MTGSAVASSLWDISALYPRPVDGKPVISKARWNRKSARECCRLSRFAAARCLRQRIYPDNPVRPTHASSVAGPEPLRSEHRSRGVDQSSNALAYLVADVVEDQVVHALRLLEFGDVPGVLQQHGFDRRDALPCPGDGCYWVVNGLVLTFD